MMDSITITDGDTRTTSYEKEPSVNMSANKSEHASTGASGANHSVSVVPAKSKPSSKKTSSTSSLEYMKAHLTEYDLISTSAKNLGGNTYQLTATVKHKTTGEVNTVKVTEQLSEGMKEILRKYR